MSREGSHQDLEYHPLPKLIVFDLDFTLWPLWVDTHVEPPFKKLHNGQIVDKFSSKVDLYQDVLHILESLKMKGIKMAVASRTGAISVAENLLEIMDLNHYFNGKEIYPGSKVKHFSNFKEKLDISYEHMVFFDDEERNIIDLSRIGVTALHVANGMTWKDLHKGFKIFQEGEK